MKLGGGARGGVREQDVLEALRVVQDPDLHKDIVTLGFVKNLRVTGGTVAFDIELTTPACPVKDRLRDEASQAVRALPGVDRDEAKMTAPVPKSVVSATEAGLRPLNNTAAVTCRTDAVRNL